MDPDSSQAITVDDNDHHALPPGFAPPRGWVHIMSPYGRPGDGEGGIMDAPLADIAFWLRLKATAGCVSKRNARTDVMHMWVKPDSTAAYLFVSRMHHRFRALPSPPSEVSRQIQKLLPPKGVIL